MLRKKEEKNERVKDEAYYAEKLEEVRSRAKGVSLIVRGDDEEEGTYQIWSFGSDDDEMRNLNHGAMYVKLEEGEKDEEYEITGRGFVLTDPTKSLMIAKVRALLNSFKIH